MSVRRRPQPGRPTISARQAAKLLRRDPRTIRRMIRDGELEGGSQIVNERTRWFVYSDQIASDDRSLVQRSRKASEVEALRAELARAHAAEATAQETNRLLLASQDLLVSAVRQYQQAAEEAMAVAGEYRVLAARHEDTAARFRNSADSFAAVIGNYRDIVAQYTTPSDLSGLKGRPQ